MSRLLLGGLLMMTAGCAPPAPPESEEPDPIVVGGDHSCDAAKVQNLVGREASADVGATAIAESGARTIRWIQPGQAVTMDYRPDRLNIELDAQNRIVALRCG